MSRSREPSRPLLCTTPGAHLGSAEHLNGGSLLFGCVLRISGGSALAALPIFPQLPFVQKIGTFFVRTGSRLRCSGTTESACRVGYIGKGGFDCGSNQLSAFPMSPSFGPFLGEARKGHISSINYINIFTNNSWIPLFFCLQFLPPWGRMY